MKELKNKVKKFKKLLKTIAQSIVNSKVELYLRRHLHQPKLMKIQMMNMNTSMKQLQGQAHILRCQKSRNSNH